MFVCVPLYNRKISPSKGIVVKRATSTKFCCHVGSVRCSDNGELLGEGFSERVSQGGGDGGCGSSDSGSGGSNGSGGDEGGDGDDGDCRSDCGDNSSGSNTSCSCSCPCPCSWEEGPGGSSSSGSSSGGPITSVTMRARFTL